MEQARKPRHVLAKDDCGCVVACLAMVTGQDYEAVARWLDDHNWPFREGGLYAHQEEQFLDEHGYVVRRRAMNHYADGKNNVLRSPWPPAPFADVHLCTVAATEDGPHHLVVMLRDGAVLDPATTEPRMLASYHKVFNVAAVYRVDDRPIPEARRLYELLIESLRVRARELGYALAVHGSLSRDIDLIAVPWTGEAVDAHELAQELLLVAGRANGVAFMKPVEGKDRYHRAGCPGFKPHGRLSWCFHLGSGPYIDLAVMPRTEPAYTTWVMRSGDSPFWDDRDGHRPPRWFGKIGTTQVFEHGREQHGDG